VIRYSGRINLSYGLLTGTDKIIIVVAVQI
jgi:hypothetical protein